MRRGKTISPRTPDDQTSEDVSEVSWKAHTAAVTSVVGEFAARCVDHAFRDAMLAAAQVHDLGKLDWRFQLLLRGGDWAGTADGEPLAKSADMPTRKRKRQEIEEDARLPKGFRHEFLSMQLAEHFGLLPADAGWRELGLHLVASHHGYGRPFAPVVPDKLVVEGRAGELCLNALGGEASLSAVERRAITPAYQIGSGVSDRFWRLTRRYGWWGLAYLEAILRLSDWEASRTPAGERKPAFKPPEVSGAASPSAATPPSPRCPEWRESASFPGGARSSARPDTCPSGGRSASELGAAVWRLAPGVVDQPSG
jgi:CRISPR-associated endonuclease/helicase Cas3